MMIVILFIKILIINKIINYNSYIYLTLKAKNFVDLKECK